MHSWKLLPNNRKITFTPHDCAIILPTSEIDIVPLDCPVCKYLLRDHDDVLEFQHSQCCLDCAIVWAHPNVEKWATGWRPSTSELKIELDKRNNIPSYIYQVK